MEIIKRIINFLAFTFIRFFLVLIFVNVAHIRIIKWLLLWVLLVIDSLLFKVFFKSSKVTLITKLVLQIASLALAVLLLKIISHI